MTKPIILLTCVALAVEVRTNAIKNPFDLVDQVNQEFEQLSSLVHGNILAAKIQISASHDDFLTNSDNVIISSTEKIQLEHETITQQVNQIKDLAKGVDITGCLEENEPLLNRLPGAMTTLMKYCIFDANTREAETKLSITYIIDIQINTVHSLKADIEKCNNNVLCLQPILNQIELAKIRLPQLIAAEVTTFNTYASSVKITVQQCSDSSVADYSHHASSIYEDIEKCVNNLLDQ